MDEADSALDKAHKELVTQWIKCYGISPDRQVGDAVSTNHWHRKGQEGVITRIYEEDAKYAVRFPDQPPTSAQVLLYEEVFDAMVTA